MFESYLRHSKMQRIKKHWYYVLCLTIGVSWGCQDYIIISNSIRALSISENCKLIKFILDDDYYQEHMSTTTLGYCSVLRFVNYEPNETFMYGSYEIICGCKGISLTCATTRPFSEPYARFANDTLVMRTLTDSTTTKPKTKVSLET